jgi:hypothetical protein
MVSLLLELTAQSGRLWIIGQSAKVAARDAGHLLLRVLLLTACAVVW